MVPLRFPTVPGQPALPTGAQSGAAGAGIAAGGQAIGNTLTSLGLLQLLQDKPATTTSTGQNIINAAQQPTNSLKF